MRCQACDITIRKGEYCKECFSAMDEAIPDWMHNVLKASKKKRGQGDEWLEECADLRTAIYGSSHER